MSFKKNWRENKVTSSDGYIVRILSYTVLSYDDGQVLVLIGAEHMAEPRTWAVNFDDMRLGSWNGERLSDEVRRKLVEKRIREVFAFLRLNIVD